MSKFDGLVAGRKRTSVITQLQNSEIAKGPGRPRAKRSDPDFKQITAIIRKDTHTAAQRLLIGREQDFSELLEELLATWVKTQN